MRERQRLELTCDPPRKIGENWSVKAVAILSFGERTISGETINFFVNSEFVSSSTTDEDGRATEDLVIPAGAISASIEAQLAGSPARARKVVALPIIIKRPAKIEIDKVGRDGKYTLLCQLVSDQGLGIAGTLLFVDEITQKTNEQSTDEKGFLSYPIKFAETEKKIKIRVKGTDMDTWIRLSGPRLRKRFQPPIADDLKGSLWDIFKRGRQKRRNL